MPTEQNWNQKDIKKKKKLTGCGIWEHWNFDKNELPKVVRPLKGMLASTATVFPGMLLSSVPDYK
jgi:hypothetical protein